MAINSKESSHDLLGVEDRIQDALQYLENQIREDVAEVAALEVYNLETNEEQMREILNQSEEMSKQHHNRSHMLNQVGNSLLRYYYIPTFLYYFSVL